MAITLIDSVIHYRKKLDRNPDEDVIINVIHKLSKIPITIEILEATHIGKCIRNLSKRNDIAGKKARVLLNKWRDTFANSQSDKSSKPTSVSKKENVNKESKSSSKRDVSLEKTVYQKEVSREHKHKHQKSSLSHNSSQQPSKKYVNGSSNLNSSNGSSHSLYSYQVKEAQLNYMDYDPHTEVSEGYNPECPEFFPEGNKTVKTKKPISIDTYEPSSVKRKLKTEEQDESVNKSSSKKLKTEEYGESVNKSSSKKLKTENHLISNSDYVESKKSEERKDKNSFYKDKSKGSSHSSGIKKESYEKVKSERDSTVKHTHKSSSDVKKSKSKESKESSTSKSKKTKPKVKILAAEEFTSSEVRFEDCLGFNDIVPLKKKKGSKSQPVVVKKPSASTDSIKNKHTERESSCSPVQKEVKVPKESSHTSKEKLIVNVPKPSTKLDIADISLTLPEIQPNYRPLPRLDYCTPKKKETLTNEDAIRFTSSRREKTAVYSGRKSCYFSEVPSLFQCCTQVLIDNIDAIEYMGEVPYFLLKPVLERCTAFQLYTIESYNPHLLESTNELWEIHCRRDYRLLTPNEHETWRDLYLRAHDERERKLKSVTANISASMSKSNPVRQVKLAYVDSVAKPPRDVARRQAKNGTALPVSQPVKAGPPSKATPRPTAPAINSAATNNTISLPSTSFAPKKPKVAPLMAKTLKSMKQCFRRK